MKLIKRSTRVISNGVIEKVFYPVFPHDKNGEEVLKWLKQEGLTFVAGIHK
jgi:peroxiredoxin